MSESKQSNFDEYEQNDIKLKKTDFGDDNSAPSDHEVEEYIEKTMEERRNIIFAECAKARKWLDLSSSQIDDLDSLTISLYLTEQHKNLELLHLGGNILEDEGLINILSGLQWHTKLRELYLGHNNFSSLGIEALIDTLPIFSNLESLGLTNIGMTDDLAVSFSSTLMDLKNLKTLLLNSNEISDNGFVALSILFSSKKFPCRVLHLGDTNPTNQGLISFFKSLHSNNTLKHLYLTDINFQNDSIQALSKMLVKNTGLEQLNLGNCNITDEGIEKMREGLLYNSTLQYLHLWGNKIGDNGAETLLEIIEDHNHSLIGLTLFGNPIQEDDILQEIKDLLKQNQSFSLNHLNEKWDANDSDGIDENEAKKDEDVKVDDDDDDDKEDNEENDEKELEEIEKEIFNAEKEYQQEKENRRLIKEKEKEEQRKVKEKVWQGFTGQNKDGLMHSTFKEK